MSEETQKADIRHIHRQMKAVCTLMQPEYQPAFRKLMKFLELQLILQDLTREETSRFQASSVYSRQETRSPCDLTAFVRAVAPVCTENERAFLRSLQNTEQTLHMLEQVRQFQNISKDTNPEDLILQFMTPGQQKTFREFDRYYSNSYEKHQNRNEWSPDNQDLQNQNIYKQKDQEVSHGPS